MYIVGPQIVLNLLIYLNSWIVVDKRLSILTGKAEKESLK